ncbi:terminase small subunit [Brevibacterium sp. PAMC21349]|nr:terminase small subunit [Brevibacterium sp. PAMC21349]
MKLEHTRVDLKLSDIEMKFCHAYVANMRNTSETARQINISRPTLNKWLKKPHIQSYLDLLGEAGIAESILTFDEAMQILTGIARGTIMEEVINFKSGQIEKTIPNTISKKQAVELYLKATGQLVQRIDITSDYDRPKPSVTDLTTIDMATKKIAPPIDAEFEEIDLGDVN